MNTSFEPKSQAPTQRAPHQESQSAKVLPSRTIVHAKLEMTEPGDHDEQEADAIANSVMSGRKIARKISSGGSGSSGIAVSSQMESQLNHLQGGGQALPEGLRSMMESGFGQDFSQVRLHTDSEAANMSSSIHAKAFTLGNDIYFNRGQFNPEATEGQRLVAHELTHVVQGTGKVGREEINYEDVYNIGDISVDCIRNPSTEMNDINQLDDLLDRVETKHYKNEQVYQRNIIPITRVIEKIIPLHNEARKNGIKLTKIIGSSIESGIGVAATVVLAAPEAALIAAAVLLANLIIEQVADYADNEIDNQSEIKSEEITNTISKAFIEQYQEEEQHTYIELKSSINSLKAKIQCESINGHFVDDDICKLREKSSKYKLDKEKCGMYSEKIKEEVSNYENLKLEPLNENELFHKVVFLIFGDFLKEEDVGYTEEDGFDCSNNWPDALSPNDSCTFTDALNKNRMRDLDTQFALEKKLRNY